MVDAALQQQLRRCIREMGEGALLDLHVHAGSRVARIEPPGEWRDRLTVRVKAQARKGQANAEVLRLLAQELAVKPQLLEMVGGASSADKSIGVSGVRPEELLAKLVHALEDAVDEDEETGQSDWDRRMADVRPGDAGDSGP